MTMRINSKFLLLLLMMLPAGLMAQREARVEGEYTLTVTEDDNITMFQAKQRAIEMAKNEAIKYEFGTLIDDITTTELSEGDGQSSSSVMGSTTARAKGIWLADRQPTQVTVEARDGKIFFTAHVWGTAREIVQSSIRVNWLTQRRGAKGMEPTTRFQQKERFFIDFQTPVDGYLAVYMVEAFKEVYCLLPYDSRGNLGRYPVKAGNSYTLFDKSVDPNAKYYTLSTQRSEESFQLVVIFSPNPFTKCIDKRNDPRHPNSLAYGDFQKWLLDIQRSDQDMVVDRRSVKVTNPNAQQE